MQSKRRAAPARPAPSVLRQISQVTHNRERERFELWVAGDLVGVLGYSSEMVDGKPVVTVLHTVLYDEFGGNGLATMLAERAMLYMRQNGLAVRPVCTFTRRYLDRHPGIVTRIPA